MRVRYDISHIDLGKDNPDTVDLVCIPDWLEPQVRDLLRRMDYANKKGAVVINPSSFMIRLPIPEGDEWKCDVDLGGGEVVKDID
jgi:hypothetical protein